MSTEKKIQQKNILTARDEAINQLNLYIKEQKEEYLQKAFDLDNTNSKIIYYRLKYLEKNDKRSFEKLSQKYKLFLNEEDAIKLNISYIDHKKDVLSILNSIKSMDPSKPKDITILNDSLNKHYPKEHKTILELEGKNRINNIPLNLNDDLTFFLKAKIKLGEILYNFVDTLYNGIIKPNSLDEEQFAIDFYNKLIPYLKVYTEIIVFYISKDDRTLVYCLLSKADFSRIDYGKRIEIAYYLKKMGSNFNEISKRTGFSIDNTYVTYDFEEKIDKFAEDIKPLFFDTIEKILRSRCIEQLIKKLVTHHKDNKNIITIDNNYINYIKKNIIFDKFFESEDYGITNVVDGIIVINTRYNYLGMIEENENQLFIFCLMIISAIHEVIGHFLKDYYYYSTQFYISAESPVKNGTKEEGGDLVEEYLFNKIKEIHIYDVLYILDILNWNKDLDNFNQFFHNNLRENMNQNGINFDSFKISDECKKLLSNFNINKGNLYMIDTKIRFVCRKKNENNLYMRVSGRCLNDKQNRFLKKNN